ncbi:hypothetical protein Enr10x_23220 [Gimesia panareensis]|uniref:Uncharacterized protein n=1 Tax=Gimesia panareensis TaxID=2527978 RepID=A0A517Q5X8_9PLAN|nr:hypothetical protein Enr10x_23220 [Gimesia panareensis]
MRGRREDFGVAVLLDLPDWVNPGFPQTLAGQGTEPVDFDGEPVTIGGWNYDFNLMDHL